MNNVSPELKFSQIAGHPKSAPMKQETAEDKGYGLSIPYIAPDDEHSKQKKIQNLAYYQELTRQIQEKKLIHSQDPPEKLFSDPLLSFQQPLPTRYIKKHEIENHTSLSKYTGQLFGGLLQRDEAAMNKLKRLEQQKEMQSFLLSQIQEKNRRKEEEKNKRIVAETAEKQDFMDLSQFSPGLNKDEQFKEKNRVTEGEQGFSKSKTMPEESELINLKRIYEQVVKEKEELAGIYEMKIGQVKDLAETVEKNPVVAQKTQLSPAKFHKKSPRPAAKRTEIDKSPIIPKGRMLRFTAAGQMLSPIPKTPETEQESIRMVKDVESSRHNLDTAGKSCFIYPDSSGNFADEIDKFLFNYDRRTIFNPPQQVENNKFTLSSISFAPRKSEKPLMPHRMGFPSDFFRASGKK